LIHIIISQQLLYPFRIYIILYFDIFIDPNIYQRKLPIKIAPEAIAIMMKMLIAPARNQPLLRPPLPISVRGSYRHSLRKYVKKILLYFEKK